MFSAEASRQRQCQDLLTPQKRSASFRLIFNWFTTDRNYGEYLQYTHPDFKKDMLQLRSDQHWIDLGAGKAQALVDFLSQFKNLQQAPSVTAVCYKLDRWFRLPNFSGKLQVHEGMFEDMAVAHWRKADIITDIFGVLSYTEDMTASLQQVFSILNKNGHLYLSTDYLRTTFRWNHEILSYTEFFKRIPGLKVDGQWGLLKITKTSDVVQVPEMILKGPVKDGAPPYRTFVVIEN